jgi:cobalt/nickel transport system permease protein
MKHSFFDKYSDGKSWVHRIDPVTKIIFFIFFSLFLILFSEITILFYPLFFLCLIILIVISRIPVIFILKNILVIIPFILLVSLSGFFTKYFNFLVLGKTFANSFFILTLLILVVNTTKFPALLDGLKQLGVPKIILILLSFTYRYFFVLIDEIEKLIFSTKMRTHKKLNWKTLGSIIGLIFVRSYERAERIYLAMRMRGFNGEIKI